MNMTEILDTLMKLAKRNKKSHSQLIYRGNDVYLVVVKSVGKVTPGEIHQTVEIEEEETYD